MYFKLVLNNHFMKLNSCKIDISLFFNFWGKNLVTLNLAKYEMLELRKIGFEKK